MTITSKIHNTYNTILILLNTTAIVALAVVFFIQEAQQLPAATTPAVQQAQRIEQPYIDPILLAERVAGRVVADIEHAAFVRHIEVRLQRLEHAQRIATSSGNDATSNTLAIH